MTEWTRENIAWSAGFIEGEGCITTVVTTERSKAYGYWLLTAASTDLDVLETLQANLGVGSIYEQKTKPPRKRAWQFKVYRQPEVYAVLAAIYPFMGARRQSRVKEALVSMGARGPWRQGRRTVVTGWQVGKLSQKASAAFHESLADEARQRSR